MFGFLRPRRQEGDVRSTDLPPDTTPPARGSGDLERWWDELPRSRRHQALLLDADDSVPDELVVTLLLYGVLTTRDLRPLGRVPQPPEVRLLLDREAHRTVT